MSRPLLLSCEAISKAFGTRSLFDGLTFGLFEGDQAGLVGPNGSGKSTLLKILAGVTTPDAGTRSVRGGVRVGYVPQDPVFVGGGTVDDVVRAALDGVDEEDRPGRVAQALGRARCPLDGRAYQSSRRGRHSLAGRRPDRAGARVPRRQPRSLFPGARGHAHARAEPRLSGRSLAGRGSIQRVSGEAGRVSARAGGLPGIAGQYRAARDRVAASGRQG